MTHSKIAPEYRKFADQYYPDAIFLATVYAGLFILPRGLQNYAIIGGIIVSTYVRSAQIVPFLRQQKLLLLFMAAASASCVINYFGPTNPTIGEVSGWIGNLLLGGLFIFVVSQADVRTLLAIQMWAATVAALFGLILFFVSLHETWPVVERLTFWGKGRNPIQAAILLASGLFAAIALVATGYLKRKNFILIAVPLLLATFLSLSRGPLLGVFAAIAFATLAYLFPLIRKKKIILSALFLIYFASTLVIINEDFIFNLFCERQGIVCRPGGRFEIWKWTIAEIYANPFFGKGPWFRFPVEGRVHSHNAILGMILAFGLVPAAAFFAFLVEVGRSTKKESLAEAAQIYLVLALPCAAAFIAVDLINPFSFPGYHYMLLWVPLGMILAATRKRET